MRFTRSLRWRIAGAYTALLFLTMGAVSIYLIDFVADRFTEDLQDRLAREASLVGRTPGLFDSDGTDHLAVAAFAQSIDGRVTVVNALGEIVADSAGPVGPQVRIDAELSQALRGRTTSIVRSDGPRQGEEMRYATVPVEIDGAVAGAVRVGAPTSTVTARVNRIIITVTSAGAAVALLSIFLSWYVAGRTTRSVLAVADGARRLASGDLDHRVAAIGTDESRDMAMAFNRMARTIRSTVTALQGERAKLSAVLDTMDDGVVVADSERQVTIVNRAATKMLGEPSGGALGARLSGTVWDHDLITLVDEALESGEQRSDEVHLSHGNRTIGAVATPIAQGDEKGVLLTIHDLTKSRQVDITRREFVSNVSHELRSPLASMKAMVETLRAGAGPDRAKAAEFLSRLDGEIDRMTTLVAELLELSRLEGGNDEINAEPFDLEPVIAETVERFSHRALAGGVTVVVTLDPDLPEAFGESGKIAQVLSNLLDNSLRFTPQEGCIRIRATANDYVVDVSVSDTGTGIAPEHLPHLFERFYKAERSRSGDGLGLGLAIVKHIVLAHGGQVGVTSEQGLGATFSFSIPSAANRPQTDS